jgi:hypothetical protein
MPNKNTTTTKKNTKTTRTKNIGARIDFQYEEVLDSKTQGLIRIGAAVVAGCPT